MAYVAMVIKGNTVVHFNSSGVDLDYLDQRFRHRSKDDAIQLADEDDWHLVPGTDKTDYVEFNRYD